MDDRVVRVVKTRFPPEPNGYLHLGHVKAMMIDFEKHKEPKGFCYLRFDDTNPETEKQEYADQIIADVRFMGYEPSKITYTSDYFPQLLELAWELIGKGKAYVDFSTQDEIKRQRGRIVGEDGTVSWGDPCESPFRNKTIEENEKDFQGMLDGKFKEGECSLRMKMEPTSDNPNMRDLVAYTVKYTPHFRSKDKYCAYPTYEFAHCVVDALEDIDYSYCSLEFVTRQESYYWLLEQLDLKKPTVYEFSRLKIQGSILSKRKIKALIEQDKLSGYDDPRLLTIIGLKRRGYTPAALKAAVGQLGHTRNESTLSIALLESCIRSELNDTAPRIFGIMDPLRVVLLDTEEMTFERPVHPMKADEYGSRSVVLRNEIYIDRSDFRLEANKKYYRLTKKQGVRLKYADGIIRYDHHDEDEEGNVTCVYVTYVVDKTTRTKGCLGWISVADAKECTYNVYGDLLKEDGSFNDESLLVKKGVIEGNVEKNKRYQIERVGYFIMDGESSLENLTMNQIVTLREDKNKNKK